MPNRSSDVAMGGATVDGVPLFPDNAGPGAGRFVKNGYRDVWALGLFVVVVLVLAAFAGYNGVHHVRNEHLSEEGKETLDKLKTWLPVGVAASFFLSMLILAAMKAFTRQFIIIANVLVIVLNVALAAYAFTRGMIVIAVIWLLISVLQAAWLYLVRNRIPFATVLLRTSVTIVTRYFGTVVVSVLALIVAAAYFAMWTFAAVPVADHFSNSENEAPAGWTYPAALGLLLALLWGTQVCAGVSHVTASGVVATWYFYGDGSMPPNATTASLKRSMTTSLGSICFGSLVVSIVKLIYYLVRSAAQHSQNDIAACIATCIMSIIEHLMEYFNVYAFTHIAIYGTSYIDAAKQTWEMVKNCFWAAYFNDSLVWPVLGMVTFFPAVALGVAAGLAAQDIVTGVVVFFICYVVLLLVMRPVYSGVTTQFVCVAECPDVMQTTNPQYYADVEEATARMNDPVC